MSFNLRNRARERYRLNSACWFEVPLTKRLSDFDVGLLLTLDALLKHQNVTHAASRLNITQSALSARLTRLRQLLNDPGT
ncbi:hypothetical protein A4R28_29865 [Mesorhizobium ciceri]|nr:hypothetical protein A4R28_29865 [Mesorhizobium ciceri]